MYVAHKEQLGDSERSVTPAFPLPRRPTMFCALGALYSIDSNVSIHGYSYLMNNTAGYTGGEI